MSPVTREWRVRVHRNGMSVDLGTVIESTEEFARCAAISKFGESDEEPARTDQIGLNEDFDVSPT